MDNYVSGGGDGLQGTCLDVNRSIGTKYELAIYMVAATALSKTTPRVMDSLNPIAPGTLIPNYTDGVWLVLQHDMPVRVPLISIDGIGIASAVIVMVSAL